MNEKSYFKSNIFVRVSYYLVVIFSFFVISPYLYGTKKIVIIFIIILWIYALLMSILTTRRKLNNNKLNILIILWILWIFFLRIVRFSTASWGNYIVQLIFFIIFIMMSFLDTFIDNKRKKTLFYWILSFITMNLIHNIILNIKFKGASTFIFTEVGKGLVNLNVGATNFSTMIFLFSGIILICLLYSKDIKKKVFLFSVILGSMYFVLVQQSRATSSILMVVMLILIYLESKSIYKDKFEKLIVYLGVLMLILITLNPIIELLIKSINNDRIVERLKSIVNLLNGNLDIYSNSNESLGSRLYLAKTSLETFLYSIKNFVIGVGYNLKTYSTMNEMIRNTGIGYHAEFIDILPTYGLLGGAFMFSIFKEILKLYNKAFKHNKIKGKLIIIYVVFIIYSFLNLSFSPEISIIIGMLLYCTPSAIEKYI